MPKFPNIYRSFTEFLKRNKTKSVLKVLKKQSIVYLYIVLIFLILIFAFDLIINLQKVKQLNFEKQKILAEENFWKNVVDKYKGYKDAYLRLAQLEYELGNFEMAKFYINQALILDPNYDKARELEKRLRNY